MLTNVIGMLEDNEAITVDSCDALGAIAFAADVIQENAADWCVKNVYMKAGEFTVEVLPREPVKIVCPDCGPGTRTNPTGVKMRFADGNTRVFALCRQCEREIAQYDLVELFNDHMDVDVVVEDEL